MQPRDPATELQLEFYCRLDHAALTATQTFRLDKIPAGKRVRIDDVRYNNPTGLVGDGTNAFALDVRKNVGGSPVTICAVFNTDTGDAGGATLAPDTWLTPALTATDADRIVSGGDTLDAVFTEDGTATLPVGHLVVRGRYV